MAVRLNALGVRIALRFFCRALVAVSLTAQAADSVRNEAFSPDQLDFYEKKIQPILAENCFKCHSHQAEKIKANLLVDSREALLKGGDTGPAIVPGSADKSLLIRAVKQIDDDLKMPPKKRLADEQIAVLAKWVDMGAPTPQSLATVGGETKGRRVTTRDTNWWAFQPVRKIRIPEAKDAGWSRNPIDHFVFAKLSAEGLKPSDEAEKRTLVRRAYFDVIGLPPSAEQVEQFINDTAPDAYEKLIDRLLADPRYGEKWARHWLDLVRYAESDGYKADSFRPQAWRYRDYVIRSFNQDTPYNRFLEEQIAADELWPDQPDALVGVSYLRLPIYEYNQRNVKAQWATIINDITDVTGDAFLGLGMQCARCHDHKFDPIPQKDYYRLQAFFAAILPRDDLPLATPGERKVYQEQLTKWETATTEIRGKIGAIEEPVRAKTAKGVIEKFPREIQAIMNKPGIERTPYEQQINDLAFRQVTDEFDKLDGKFHGSEKQKLDALEDELEKFDDLKPKPLPQAMLVADVGPTPPPTTLPRDKTQTPVEPGVLTLLSAEPMEIGATSGGKSTGRRAALAKWLARPDNQFTSRVMVNRIWQLHFGRGLVATLNDFGHLGEQPSHPELLDWLAKYFVDHNWSVKAMHRLILTSATYRQSATGTAGATIDPENRLLWRQNLRRLESDQIRDAMLWTSGELDSKMGGPSVDPSKPRRTIYTKWLRNSRDALLEAFDPPDPYVSMPQRNVTTTPMQSLVLINGPYALQRGQALAKRINAICQDHDDEAAEAAAAYRLVFSRDPSDNEKSRATQFLREQAQRIAKSGTVARINADVMPKRSGTAALFRPDRQARMQVPDNPLMPQYDFTIEAFVLLRSIDNSGELRTIVSRWDGRKDQPGWSFGLSGKNGSWPAQTLVLQLIGDPAEDGVGGYEAIPSGLQLELDTPYYVAVSVRIGDTSDTGVAFYAKELTAGAALRAARVPHRVTSNHQSNLPVIIGGRDPEKHLIWDGLIDDVRLSRRALKPDELLLARENSDENTVGFWRFEEPDFFKDSSPNGHNIRSEISPAAAAEADPRTSALIDFCHVLLNSNEFLYTE
jgi:hypothetical protein